MAKLFQQKLIIPTAAHTLIERDAIVARLDQTISSKRLVVLAAPAGWGKTTILAQWASRSPHPVVWYTLGSGDRDPHVFLEYLLQAVAPVVPQLGALAEQLVTTSPQRLADLYHAAALEIATASAPFALVLDDFHVVEDELALALPGTELIFELLGAIMEYATNCHLVIASRILPDRQGLARMVVQQRATVFDYLTLQFTAADVQSLARASATLRLDDASAEELTAQLGGWAAGIVLSLNQAAQADGQFLPDGNVDVTQVYDYFAEQIVAPLDDELQRFLEDISVLEDLSPQRCNTLRGRSDSARFLNEARRRGLFTAHRGDWLVYHSLFRDFLRVRLAQDPGREQALLRSAGNLYGQEEDIERAIDCYLSAQAVDEVIALLRAAVPRFLQRSRQTLLLSCFERLGGFLAEHNQQRLPPDMLLLQARVYRDLALWERAELALQLAEALGDAETRWEASILHAELLNLQDKHERATAVLGTISVAVLPSRLQPVYYQTAGRVQVLAGRIGEAIASFEQAHTLILASAEESADPSALAAVYDLLGWAYTVQGDQSMALRYLQRADACWQSVGNHGRRTMTLNNLGIVALQERRYAEARAAFQAGLELARQTARRREEVELLCSSGDFEIAEGHLLQASVCFREAYALAVRMDLPTSQEAAIGVLWSSAIQGDSGEADVWQQIVQSKGAVRGPADRGKWALARSLLLLRQTRPDLAALKDFVEQAAAVEASLVPVERAVLALLRAIVAFEQHGWPEANAEWERFVQSSIGVSESLLMQLVVFHRRLFEAAAAVSPLARRLIAARQSQSPRQWRILALGNFACLVDGVACDLSPLHRALLVCLLEAGQQGIGVEQLWESIWGDSDLSMPALHQALYRLRSQTGLSMAAREGVCKIYSLWEAIDYDVRRLEKILNVTITHQAIQRACELYRGDFLLSAPLSAAHWADARRAHLRQRYLDRLEEYAISIEHEMPDRAIQYYQQILQIDGCREQTAARLMRIAAGSGNYSLVSETFDQLESNLRLLGVAPETDTRALLRVSVPRELRSALR